jgi:hypothetical protein
MAVGREFRAENGSKTLLMGLRDKSDGAVQSIRIGQRHGGKSTAPRRATQRFQR